jgi:hypothetical protein
MNPLRRLSTLGRNAALWVALMVVVLAMLLAALGFLVAAFEIWLAQQTNPAEAAAITGAGLLVIAVLLGVIGNAVLKRSRARQQTMLAAMGGSLGLAARVIGIAVRNDPKKALILSIIAGAVAEYVASDRKK